jgi:hypothetical protein
LSVHDSQTNATTAGQDDRAKEEMLVEEMLKQNDKVMATTEIAKPQGLQRFGGKRREWAERERRKGVHRLWQGRRTKRNERKKPGKKDEGNRDEASVDASWIRQLG